MSQPAPSAVPVLVHEIEATEVIISEQEPLAAAPEPAAPAGTKAQPIHHIKQLPSALDTALASSAPVPGSAPPTPGPGAAAAGAAAAGLSSPISSVGVSTNTLPPPTLVEEGAKPGVMEVSQPEAAAATSRQQQQAGAPGVSRRRRSLFKDADQIGPAANAGAIIAPVVSTLVTTAVSWAAAAAVAYSTHLLGMPAETAVKTAAVMLPALSVQVSKLVRQQMDAPLALASSLLVSAAGQRPWSRKRPRSSISSSNHHEPAGANRSSTSAAAPRPKQRLLNNIKSLGQTLSRRHKL